jgi:DNA recombination protein RmuC
MQAAYGIIALIAGFALGYLIRQAAAKKEKDFAASEKAQLSQRCTELGADLAGMRAELARIRELAESRAGFESLCAERQATIDRMAADTQATVDRLTRERQAEAARLVAERDNAAAALQLKIDSERTLNAQVSGLEAELRKEREAMGEKISLLDQARQSLANQFEALAAEILEKKAKSFAETSQKDLGTLLSPLQTQLREFRERVEKVQTDSNTGVTELKTLIGTLGSLNQQLTQEARNLTTALRGSSKAQGDWGELIVRNLLEKAGLREGEEFRIQETFDSAASEDERKKARPDVILNLPGGRHLVIDSKVSLNAYTDSVNAATEEERKLAMKRHIASLRAHVDGLTARKYHKLSALDSPDFVVMFVPIEPAFLSALYEDESLWRYGYEREVLLVGPTTLLFVIRIVDNLWQQEMQARNVQEVMDRGAALYEKFVGFVSDLEAIGSNLRKVDQCYTGAMKKLSDGPGNLVRQVEMLKQLGVRSSKALPKNLLDQAGVEEEPLALAASAAEPIPAE